MIERCEPHNLQLPCILCLEHSWPVRDIQAVADFAGSPVNGPDGLIPGVEYIALSEVIRIIGRKMRDLETIRLDLFKPFYKARTRLRKEARIGAITPAKLERAAISLAAGRTTDEDPLVALYMRTITEDKSDW